MPIGQFVSQSINAVLLVGALGFFMLALVFLAECIAALLPKKPIQSLGSKAVRLTVLVPAHNEAAGIQTTLATIFAAIKQPDRVVVIADNCTDATAEIARTTGSEVIERHDDRRGKGYALSYGIQFLESDPPDIVIVVDADCQVQPGAIEQLAEMAIATGKPIQAKYLMAKPANPTPQDSISAFSITVKNLVRPQGASRLGFSCLLTGSGMAFPWSVIRAVDLASGHIVEDMKLGLDLALIGHNPLFCADATIMGELPQQQATKSQRTRWEHGHLQTMTKYVPQLLKASILQKRLDLLMLALDLSVLPLALFVLVWVALVAGTLLVGVTGGFWVPLALSLVAGLCLFSSIIAAWARFGRQDLTLTELLAVPLYILGKIPLYLKYLVKPQDTWVRTERTVIKKN